jgi:hypothetical protein
LGSAALSRLVVPRMLTAGSLVTSATAVRVAVGWVGLWAQRTPALVRLGVSASVGGRDSGRAQATFRDDVLALARESAEVSWRELRRGIADLDSLTRARAEPGARPHRPYRVKL